MNYIITGKNITVTDALRNIIIDKLSKLEKYFSPDTNVMVTLNVEKDRQRIEVTIPVKGNIIRSEQVSTDMYVSIDLVVEVLERQLKRFRSKIVDKHQEGGAFFADVADDEMEDNDGPKIVRTKKFAVKPMDAEEACIQMELLGHSFYVFRDSETFEVNVVYKRKDGTYGLIEPEE